MMLMIPRTKENLRVRVRPRNQRNRCPATISISRWGETPSSRRPMKWGGIPHCTKIGKVPLFLIYCLSARTARRSLSPPRTRSSSSRQIISSNSGPLETRKNPIGCPFEREARSKKCSRDFSPYPYLWRGGTETKVSATSAESLDSRSCLLSQTGLLGATFNSNS